MKLNFLIKNIKKYNLKNTKIFKTSKNLFFDIIIVSTSLSIEYNKYIYNDINKIFKKFILNNIKKNKDNFYDWIILDFNNILLNIMLENIRIYYDIDNLYNDIYEK